VKVSCAWVEKYNIRKNRRDILDLPGEKRFKISGLND
jgi:hypothetical protein